MASKLNYDSKEILNVKFSAAPKGYDPLEVDQTFDKIIEDYNAFVSMINEVKIQNEKQQVKIEELKSELEKTRIELINMKKQYDLLKSTSAVSDDNIKLLTKIAAYEKVLHKRGINLKKALSDPDNC